MKSIIAVTILVVGLLLSVFGYLSWKSKTVKAGAAPQLVLYSEENFTGRSVVITGTTFDLPVVLDAKGEEEFNWNDEVRSIGVISGTWRLYQHGRCNTELDETQLNDFSVKAKAAAGGWSTLVSATSAGPLWIPNVQSGGIWRDVSSIELISDQNLPDWAMDFRR